MKTVALFNNKGGVGKTTLAFHIAHMLARMGRRTLALDYDPQANLTAIFLDEEQLEKVWSDGRKGATAATAVENVRIGKGDIVAPDLHPVADNLWLLPGDLRLSRFEQNLAEEWAKKADSNNQRALDVTFALDALSSLAAESLRADVVLVDVGPSLGALNRAALLACDAIVVPLAPDLFSLQGLENIGPTLEDWRADIRYVREHEMKGREQAKLRPHEFRPIGYIVQQHLARVDRPVSGYKKWADKIPATYRRSVLQDTSGEGQPLALDQDPHCIFTIKHVASLAPIAQQHRKPMFDLRQADGIGGGQLQAVARCRSDFQALCRELLLRLESV